MRVIICLIYLFSICLSAQSESFIKEFNKLLSSDEPEKAEELLLRLKENSPELPLNNYHATLGESFFRNHLFKKSLKHYRLSGNLKLNKRIYYYHKAEETPGISSGYISSKRQYLRKSRIDELRARYFRTFLNNVDLINESFKIYRRIMLLRFKGFMMKMRPDRAEKYIIANLEYIHYNLKKLMYYKLGKAYLRSYQFRDYDKAFKYINLSGNILHHPQLNSYHKGMQYFRSGDFKSAYQLFLKSKLRHLVARTLTLLASKDRKCGKSLSAEKKYRKALTLYNSNLFTTDTPWEPEDTSLRITCINFIRNAEKRAGRDKLLKKILSESGNYSRTLNNYAIYYYCKELVSEQVQYKSLISDQQRTLFLSDEKKRIDFSRNRKQNVVFDYQIIKERDKIKENRTIFIPRNRKKKKKWSPHTITVQNYFYGPVGLFHPSMQDLYYYELIPSPEDMKDSWIVDVTPMHPDEVNPQNGKKFLYGRVWIDKQDYSISKVAWIPRHSRRTRVFTNIANMLERNSEISFVTCFDFKKGVLRYPSSGIYSEYFKDHRDIKERFSQLNIKFTDYRFFNTATRIEKEQLYRKN